MSTTTTHANRTGFHPTQHTMDMPAARPGAKPPTRPSDEAMATEWLLTNRRGSFAMGTAAGVNTRRYHALLVAATLPPVGRVNTLNSVNEIISFDGQRVELANHEFAADDGQSVFHPRGFEHLVRFEKDTACRWIYHVGPLRITKQLRLAWRHDAAELSYRVEPAVAPTGGPISPSRVTLEVHPLMAMRDFHHLTRHGEGNMAIEQREDRILVHPAGVEDSPPLHLVASAGAFLEHQDWWRHFARRVETARGQDDQEDLVCPGRFEHTFEDVGGSVSEFTLRFGIDDPAEAFADNDDERAEHLAGLVEHVRKQVTEDPAIAADLVVASDDFVVIRRVDEHDATTILAGYPWFADWGRDTMIALPGLLLTTGRFDEAADTLLTFARHTRNGLVPNRFDDYGGEPHYNTVDASLWFIHAALEYRRLTGDETLWRESLAPSCREIIDAYQHGTEGPIGMDDDGLISAGDHDTQLTWMDAARDGVVFTPRHGKAVEINALWYRALTGCAEAFAEIDAKQGKAYAALARKVKKSFNDLFWNDSLGYCIDHVEAGGHVDESLRPNQAFAVSLPGGLLTQARQRKVMKVVREKLLTPRGLRTLPQDDPHYHGNYGGGMFERDRAYHQGTVWAWLMGPYVEGYLRAHDFSAAARKHTREALQGLLDELNQHSFGQIHEIYTGDPPHHPDGCPAQAWSVAETLRTYLLIQSSSR